MLCTVVSSPIVEGMSSLIALSVRMTVVWSESVSRDLVIASRSVGVMIMSMRSVMVRVMGMTSMVDVRRVMTNSPMIECSVFTIMVWCVVIWTVPAVRHMKMESRTTMLLMSIWAQMRMVHPWTVTWFRIMTSTPSAVL